MKYEEFVLTDNIEIVQTKINKMNKKAIKLNLVPLSFQVTPETKTETIKEDGYKTTYHYTKIIIEGEEPKLSGWSLNSIINFDPDMGMMINNVPEKEMPVEFRESTGYCEHCQSQRGRSKVFVLEKNLVDLTEDEIEKYL